ncbi:MAG TPA: hypothetical protein VGY55_24590 [Pirellulales bacterium]|jgi:hypothetical protein|nr:hypothetical protein [Pirellulales bacterium]
MKDRTNIRPLLGAIAASCIAAIATISISRNSGAEGDVCPPRRYAENGYDRAGNPQEVACRARPSDSSAFSGYYVGGGAPHRGEPRYFNEGTWGWDYFGFYFQRGVQLDWWHGQRSQGGPGAYQTDGPRLIH